MARGDISRRFYMSQKISKQEATQMREMAEAIMKAKGLDPVAVRYQQDLAFVSENAKFIVRTLKSKEEKKDAENSTSGE